MKKTIRCRVAEENKLIAIYQLKIAVGLKGCSSRCVVEFNERKMSGSNEI